MVRPAAASGAFVAAPRADMCLEFANTLSWRGSTPAVETLHGIDDLLRWAAASTGIDRRLPGRCRTAWGTGPAGAQAFAEAIGLRETIYRLFAAAAENRNPPATELTTLNRVLGSAPQRSRVRVTGSQYAWAIDGELGIATLLAPVLWSAGDLLAGPHLARVRSCANERCRWLFLDDSKSGTRRWCSMSACGNRAKAHRHYMKHRDDG